MAVSILYVLILVGIVALVVHLLRKGRLSGTTLLLAAGLLLIAFALFLLARAHGPAQRIIVPVLVFGLLGLALVLLARFLRRRVKVASAWRPVVCPPIHLLQHWLAERLSPPDHARLAAHLEICTACQHRVEGLTAGQECWDEMARKLSERPTSAGPALQEVITRLKGSPDKEGTKESALGSEMPLGFLDPPAKEGQLGRLDRYEVLEEVGRGGMGIVLKAFDPSLHRVVAIKVLTPQLATSGVARQRFLREAKAAAAVTHDHIVTIHAVDEANGLPYLVMQYVAGLSLQERIDRDGPISDLALVVRIGLQTASALEAAHRHGLVHRDVKPANILMEEEGVPRVKITDFGLARAMDDASLTQSGVVAGSPLYMAPEQARGEALDPRADLFSLGSVLYTACTGRPPFRAANTLAVLRRVCEDVPRPIGETNPEVPAWLAAVVEKLMAKDPAARYPSAAEVVEVLGRHLTQPHHPGQVQVTASNEPGLPTSLTLCASCGVSLYVPDTMVGATVHCGGCGAPFRAEPTAEEIKVARVVPSPFAPRPWWKRPWWKRKIPIWGWVVIGVVALLLLVLLSAEMSSSESPQMGSMILPEKQGATPEARANPFWKTALGWFPAGAVWFGAVDLRPFGSCQLGDEWTQTALRLGVPAEAHARLTPENLGRVRIDGLSMASYGDPKSGESQIVGLEGLFLDGLPRVVESIRDWAPGTVRVAGEKGRRVDKNVLVSGPELPFALGFLDESRVFVARSLNKDHKEPQHLKTLQRVPQVASSAGPTPAQDLLSGYNPPWFRLVLNELPADVCGVALGEIPPGWRTLLSEALKLRACPRTFVCSLKREGSGVRLSVKLYPEKPGAERLLLEDLEKWRRGGLGGLQVRFPALGKERQALAVLQQAHSAARWGVRRDGSVGAEVHLSGTTGKAVAALVKVATLRGKDGEQAP